MQVRNAMAVLLFTLGTISAYADDTTFHAVLGHEKVQKIVDDEVAAARKNININGSFVEWSVPKLESAEAPSDPTTAVALLQGGYHKFVTSVMVFARSLGIAELTAETAEHFFVLNVRCGPIPCNRKKCCNFCQDPCKKAG